ncbi:MAG: alpha/beta fold hydrolase [Gammaproteobacteria bacterium]
MVRYFVGAEGQSLASEHIGPDTAAPVILAHGAGQTRAAWRNTAAALVAAGWRVIALDLRGHGESAWSPSGAYRLEDFAADLLAVADQLDTKPALVGASLGGLAGLIAEAEQRAASFTSLTMVDIAPSMELPGVARVLDFMGAHVERGFASVEEAVQVISSYLPQRSPRQRGAGIERYLRLCDDGRYRWHWDPRFIQSAQGARVSDSMDRLTRAAQKLSLPVHLIRGGMSDLVSEKSVADFLKLVPQAAYTDIVGAGHMVVGDRNDAFCDAIVKFLNAPPHGAS